MRTLLLAFLLISSLSLAQGNEAHDIDFRLTIESAKDEVGDNMSLLNGDAVLSLLDEGYSYEDIERSIDAYGNSVKIQKGDDYEIEYRIDYSENSSTTITLFWYDSSMDSSGTTWRFTLSSNSNSQLILEEICLSKEGCY